jgi:hypothetical protein
VIPKTVKSLYLKLKINAQMMLGNAFGFRFKSLEANIEKLDKIEKDFAASQAHFNGNASMNQIRQ